MEDHDTVKAMLEFAKLHVTAALKAADKAAENQFPEEAWLVTDDINFILKSYNLTNIK